MSSIVSIETPEVSNSLNGNKYVFVCKFWFLKIWRVQVSENLLHVLDNILRWYNFKNMLIKERHQPDQWLEVIIARSISDYFGLKETIEYFERSR